MSPEIEAISRRILGQFKVRAIDVWDRWSPAVRQLAEQCAMDAGHLAVLAAGGQDVSAEVAQINAQLSNLRVSVEQSAVDALWNIVAGILQEATTAILAV